MNGTPVVPTQTSGKAVSVTDKQGPVKPDIQETEVAASQGKPSLLYFYWPSSEDAAGKACKQLDTKVWVDGKVQDLAQQFVCIKVDGKKCPKQVLTVFGVKAFPTIVFQTCNKKIVSSVRSKCVAPKVFAKAMEAVSKTNARVVKVMKAQAAKLDKQVEGAGKLLSSGKLDAAEKAFRKLIKDSPESDQAGIARSGLEEISCRRHLAKAKELLQNEKFAEARSLLTMAAEVDVACLAKDEARELLPDCEFGLLYKQGCDQLAAGKNADAMATFTKIAGDDCYTGKYLGLAKQKLQEMKDAWNKRSN